MNNSSAFFYDVSNAPVPAGKEKVGAGLINMQF